MMAGAQPVRWVWPQADAAVPPAPHSVHFPDLSAFAAVIAPELGRTFGVHVRADARAGRTPADAALILLARLPADTDAGPGAGPGAGQSAGQSTGPSGGASTEILASETHAGALADLLFGGLPAAETLVPLTRLPPASASWTTLAEFVGRACAQALASAGLASRLPVDVPSRAALDAGAPAHMLLDLDFDGTPLQLAFRLPEAAAADPAAPTDAGWRRAVEDRIRRILLTVSLRIAAQPMRLGDVASLTAGDILPLDPPEAVDVLVGGEKFARLRIGGLHPPVHAPEVAS